MDIIKLYNYFCTDFRTDVFCSKRENSDQKRGERYIIKPSAQD